MYALEYLQLGGGEQTTGEELMQLGVPSEACELWERFRPPLNRSVVIARDGEQVLGAALSVWRTLGEYVKIPAIWTADGAGELESALLERSERHAWSRGALAVKREGAINAAGALGYQPVAVPPMPGPGGVEQAPLGQFRWREPRTATSVPYVRQTSNFTCGPCSLLMALGHFGMIATPDRETEFALWREATMVEACDPYGLALTAARHGLSVELTVTTAEFMLLEEFDSQQEREVRRFLQSQFRRDLKAAGIATEIRRFDADDVREVIESGRLAIVLIDEDPFGQGSCPHWIVVHSLAGDGFLVHDPWTGNDAGESWIDAYDLPLRSTGLEQLCAFGDPAYSALLAVGRR